MEQRGERPYRSDVSRLRRDLIGSKGKTIDARDAIAPLAGAETLAGRPEVPD